MGTSGDTSGAAAAPARFPTVWMSRRPQGVRGNVRRVEGGRGFPATLHHLSSPQKKSFRIKSLFDRG